MRNTRTYTRLVLDGRTSTTRRMSWIFGGLHARIGSARGSALERVDMRPLELVLRRRRAQHTHTRRLEYRIQKQPDSRHRVPREQTDGSRGAFQQRIIAWAREPRRSSPQLPSTHLANGLSTAIDPRSIPHSQLAIQCLNVPLIGGCFVSHCDARRTDGARGRLYPSILSPSLPTGRGVTTSPDSHPLPHDRHRP